MTADQHVGHFHGDDVAVGSCCCPSYDTCGHPLRQWLFYPTDVAQGYAPANCDLCGAATCSPQQIAEAQRWVELYG